MTRVLLDTCAAIWFAEGKKFSPSAADVFEQGLNGRTRVFVSPITAWEVGLLVARNRYRTALDVPRWFDLLIEHGRFEVAELSAHILAKSSFLPDFGHADPADRIVVATAREHGHVIMTHDRKILDYANRGNVQAMPC